MRRLGGGIYLVGAITPARVPGRVRLIIHRCYKPHPAPVCSVVVVVVVCKKASPRAWRHPLDPTQEVEITREEQPQRGGAGKRQ